MRVDVGNSQGTLCTPPPFGEIACPTGGIVITDNGNPFTFQTFNLNSEGYTESWDGAVTLTGGDHTLAGQYSGDNNYEKNSGTVVITVTKAATNTTPVGAQSTDFTQPVTLTTWIQDPRALPALTVTPSGTVTFYANGKAIPGTPTYSMGSNGVFLYTTATLVTTFSSPGTYTLSAAYSGDQNYQASTSPTSSLVLLYPAPGISLTPASQTVAPGSSITVNALVDTTNKTVHPTGTITFVTQSSGVILAGPVTCASATDNTGNFACQAAATFTVNSSLGIVANYSGDTNYPVSFSPVAFISVPDFGLNVGPSQVSLTQGQSQTVPINVNAMSGFTGVVSNFACSGLPAEATCSFSPASVSGNGSTTLTISAAALGQSLKRAQSDNPPLLWAATGGAFLLGICMIGAPISRRQLRVLLALFVVSGLAALPSCGGGSGGGMTSANNPVPSITSLSPSQVAAGSAAQTLTITGSGFISSSSVTVNGISRAANYSGSSQISVGLLTSDQASTGSFPVVVTNPTPGGGSSGSANFSVVSGTPTGTFNITVTASSGTLTHNTTFTLAVQ